MSGSQMSVQAKAGLGVIITRMVEERLVVIQAILAARMRMDVVELVQLHLRLTLLEQEHLQIQ